MKRILDVVGSWFFIIGVALFSVAITYNSGCFLAGSMAFIGVALILGLIWLLLEILDN